MKVCKSLDGGVSKPYATKLSSSDGGRYVINFSIIVGESGKEYVSDKVGSIKVA